MAKPYAVPESGSLFDAEERVLKFWATDNTFQKSLDKNPADQTFSFYDGPPFITGLPHYGTLLPSIAKDIIPRYQTMKGKRVRRQWGWDVHGLPAENQVEKQLELKGKKDIETLGVKKFIDACRQYVSSTSEQWNWYVDHIGRWADMDSVYRTDDLSYMESVMHAFKTLYDQGLIYQGRRVSLYCPRCATPLSKFEITMDDGNYKDVEDPAVTVGFALTDEDAFVLAWTTTPWTLPANLALAVDKDAEYVKVTDGTKHYILAHVALERYREMDWEIVETFKGSELVGKKYQSLYHFFETDPAKDYQIYAGDFVAMEEGTGVVHIAPGFGEDDTRLGEEEGLSLLLTINDEGHFTEQVKDWRGLYYKKANPLITADLKKRGLLIREEVITHSYPHCYRCTTPLIYKSQVSWYLKISELKDKLLAANKDINWLPEHFGAGRFAYNLESAPEWSISRTRYWGSPIPVWQTEDGENIVVGSIKELEELSGVKVTDLHRPTIDDVVIMTPDGKKAHRVKEVLDCWFESGAMPYAQDHYPFENKEEFAQHFPADFIIEYTGQLRGWFYYLHVLANALKGENAFKNVVVTGVLMGTDGRKMSKSYGNYPDPKLTIEKYGAESLRLYFMASKVMNGEDPAISEEEIREASRLLQTLHNSFKYFVTYANVSGFAPGAETQPSVMDRWITARLEEFIVQYADGLDRFDFMNSTKAIRPFVEDLSTWYIRRSRDRFVTGDAAALSTLHDVLLRFAVAVAPTLPFIAEQIFQTLTQATDSVHLQNYPIPKPELVSESADLFARMDDVRAIASVAHKIRADEGVSLRQPLAALALKGFKELETEDDFLEILREELNVSEIIFDKPKTGFVLVEHNGKDIGLDVRLTPELKEEGQYRELLRKLQDERKKAGLAVGQKVEMQYFTEDKEMLALMTKRAKDIAQAASFTGVNAADSADGLTTLAGDPLSIKFVA